MRDKVRSHLGLATLADRQYGVVAVRQLLELGYSRDAVARAATAGRLHRVHRGVYAVGYARLSAHGRCLAAVLACGRNAVLSHFAAAWLWGLSKSGPGKIDVTVPTRGKARGSIQVHHAPALTESDGAILEDIPVTALPRTLLDLAAVAPRRIGGALERSEQLESLDLRAVESLLARCSGHAGAGRLRNALASYREPAFTRSGLERRFLRLVRMAGLPMPSANSFVAGFEIDMYWERERFGVELDTYAFHGGRVAFERDRMRQEELKMAGVEIIRVTGKRLDRVPDLVIERVAALLSRAQSRGASGTRGPSGRQGRAR